jgi:hypothetical protein
VNWLRSKARYARWQEEVKQLKYEMVWTVRSFEHSEKKWQKRLDEVNQGRRESAGLRSYAAKQRSMWRKFKEQADETFRVNIPEFRSVLYPPQ